jgi:hypothetical protein
MKKNIFLAWLFMIALAFNACKKEDTNSDLTTKVVDKEIVNKVNSWLESKKPTGKAVQTANVELLKSNLNFFTDTNRAI